MSTKTVLFSIAPKKNKIYKMNKCRIIFEYDSLFSNTAHNHPPKYYILTNRIIPSALENKKRILYNCIRCTCYCS